MARERGPAGAAYYKSRGYKRQISLHVREYVYVKLKRLARMHGKPLQEYIRVLLAEAVKQRVKSPQWRRSRD